MKRFLLISLILCGGNSVAWAQSNTAADAVSNASGGSTATSQSGNMSSQMGQQAEMGMGNITFGDSIYPDSQRIRTTPNVYTAPSMFGGANSCGQSNTLGVGVTGFGIGGSMASESDPCNAREDTATAYRLGYQDVAVLRFFCFGEDENRLAWVALGNSCPPTAQPIAQVKQRVVSNSSTLSGDTVQESIPH
ncbi:hypothetical protein LKR43_04825 [Pusillimonas sp. MFBS29]|uniref:hypothetical protein n=1 Tax=Pusillimonas sp. MFBS29 TaxID=2886690 RepID=UPI001D11C712|nr:hypothetical protein [Pusillimonas sp. MFBS29]MCC2595660.1 hypothetical protein [Pusillimonas sp. MFBS29]